MEAAVPARRRQPPLLRPVPLLLAPAAEEGSEAAAAPEEGVDLVAHLPEEEGRRRRLSVQPDTAVPREARARDLLKTVGLAERLEHRPAELSGGERARVALVRALVNGPRLLLADEPTGALDAHTSEELGGLLLELNRSEGVALVVVTHAERLAERIGGVLELREGRLIER